MMKSHSNKKIELRPYQRECINSIPDSGSYLIQMATGLGKTVTFSQIPRKGRMLILSHRQELVEQPVKYFDVPVGIEQATRTSGGEEVISASVQTLNAKDRYKKFPKDYFDIIITDEAHHAAAQSYQKLYKYFKPRLHLGFTATPNRHDRIGLHTTYKKVIYEYGLKKGIEDGWLCDINCIQARVAVDFNSVKSRAGDFVTEDLSREMKKEMNVEAVAEAYRDYGQGQTLIFAVSKDHAKSISEAIPGSAVILGDTPKKEREQIIEDFRNEKINVLVNCMVLTEGTDIPNIQTIIMARPTQSETLYSQMVGRGVRKIDGKQKLNLVDLVGISSCNRLCTAPVLLGLDPSMVPESRRSDIQGDLLGLEFKINDAMNTFDNWIRSAELVDIWAKEVELDTHDINFTRMADGSLKVLDYTVPAPDPLLRTNNYTMQYYIDRIWDKLRMEHANEAPLWDLNIIRYWKDEPATDKQKWLANRLTRRKYKDRIEELTKFEASQIISRFKG